MKYFIKKLIAMSLMVLALTAVLPKKEAKAGFLILAATDQFVLNHKYETLDNLIPYIAFATMIPFGFWFTETGYSMQTLYSGLFVLDAHMDQAPHYTKAALMARFPFIDDQVVIEKISQKILTKYQTVKKLDEEVNVILSENEIHDAIDCLDLTDAQVNELVNTLGQ